MKHFEFQFLQERCGCSCTSFW